MASMWFLSFLLNQLWYTDLRTHNFKLKFYWLEYTLTNSRTCCKVSECDLQVFFWWLREASLSVLYWLWLR
jgi:hypothetical protein